jgi:magnesium chelatase subunit D
MTVSGADAPDALDDAIIAARLIALDPAGLGGMLLGGGDVVRDDVLAALASALPRGAPVRRMPGNIDDDRLLGGIDLGATLAQGSAVWRTGLLAEADGGVLIVPMVERLGEGIAARIAGALDTGEVVAERDGMTLAAPAVFAVIALDDGRDGDDAAPLVLSERLAFRIDLRDVRPRAFHGGGSTPIVPATERIRAVEPASPDILEAITATAAILGIDSIRAPIFALRAARAAAALAGRSAIAQDDVVLAARLVLGPRATRLPPVEEAPPAPDEAPPSPPDSEREGDDQQQAEQGPVEDMVLAAALTSLPGDLLAEIARGGSRRGPASRGRGKGERRRSPTRGRPVGVRAGVPRGGLRLSLIDTLRAAAPWQKLRRGEGASAEDDLARVRIRRDDLRIRRFESRAEATTIFAVDASGSSALTRLAEAKGAVELLLAEAYVKRAHVALVAFRGQAAELLLPPTRSLVRAKRSLADLPGGGGTPIAAGLNAARDLAQEARARGRTPFIVVLTDGRANVAVDGSHGREAADADAMTAARAIGASGVKAAFVDISPRPRPEGAALAQAMGARYLSLPRADATQMHAAVKAAQSC